MLILKSDANFLQTDFSSVAKDLEHLTQEAYRQAANLSDREKVLSWLEDAKEELRRMSFYLRAVEKDLANTQDDYSRLMSLLEEWAWELS